MTTPNTGLAVHLHDRVLFEWCWDYDDRVDYIKANKPAHEQTLRLALFKLVPTELVSHAPAWAAFEQAAAAFGQARAAFEQARAAYG